MRKPAYKALFPAQTFVDVDENSLDQVFLYLNDSPQRRRLVTLLRHFIQHLKSLGLESFELWVDGSFSTFNPSPADIDLVCFLKPESLFGMENVNLEELKKLGSEEGRPYVREKWSIDFYIGRFDSLEEKNSWKKKFFEDENGLEKGIGRIKI